MNPPDPNSHPSGRSRLAFGVILLILGVMLLALNLGVSWPWHLWKYFSIPFIAFGLWGIVSPSRHLDRVGGIWLLAVGLFCLIGTFGLFGLGWGSAWPIFIIASGFSLIFAPSRSRHERSTPADQVTNE